MKTPSSNTNPHRHIACIAILLLMLLPARAEDPSACPIVTTIPTVAATEVAASSRSGDVNGDGRVNVTDVMMMVRYVMGENMSAYPDFKATADLNRDDQVTVTDVMIVVKIIMGMPWSDPDNPTLIIDDDEGRDPSSGL